MGTFTWPMRITAMDGQQTRDVEAMVDTGATYTTLPASLLRELGVEPVGQRRFRLADDQRVHLDYGRAWITINGESEVSIVAFGGDDVLPLLGAFTLEAHALAVDPVEQRLVPATMFLL